MEIKIRDVDIRAIKVLDEEAKEQNLSRNNLLKRIVEDRAKFDGVKRTEKELDVTLDRVAAGLEMAYQRLDDLEKQTLKTYLLLCDGLGIDPKESENILEKSFDKKSEKEE